MLDESYVRLNMKCQKKHEYSIAIGAYPSKYLAWGEARRFVPFTGFMKATEDSQLLAHGMGSFTLGTGDHYCGQFTKGELTGYGKRFYARTGSQYVGEFLEGEPHGRGVMSYSDHPTLITFSGEWRLGFYHGHGEVLYKDGSVFMGNFKQHRIHGDGHFKGVDGVEYRGRYADGKCNGWGKCTYPDGRVYEGVWKDGVRHGPGLITSPSGVRYNGPWENDRPAGYPLSLCWAGSGDGLTLPLGCAVSIAVAIKNSRQQTMHGESGRQITIKAFRRLNKKKSFQEMEQQDEIEKLIYTKLGFNVTPACICRYTPPAKQENVISEKEVITLPDPFAESPKPPTPSSEQEGNTPSDLLRPSKDDKPSTPNTGDSPSPRADSVNRSGSEKSLGTKRVRVRRNYAGAHEKLADVLANLEASMEHVFAVNPGVRKIDVRFEYVEGESNRLIDLKPLHGGRMRNGCFVFPNVFIQPHDTINEDFGHDYIEQLLEEQEREERMTSAFTSSDIAPLVMNGDEPNTATKVSAPQVCTRPGIQFDPFAYFRSRFLPSLPGTALRLGEYGPAITATTTNVKPARKKAPAAGGEAVKKAKSQAREAKNMQAVEWPKTHGQWLDLPPAGDAADDMNTEQLAAVALQQHYSHGNKHWRRDRLVYYSKPEVAPKFKRLDFIQRPVLVDELPVDLPRPIYRAIPKYMYEQQQQCENVSRSAPPLDYTVIAPTNAGARPFSPIVTQWKNGQRVTHLPEPKFPVAPRRLLRPEHYTCFQPKEDIGWEQPWSHKHMPPSRIVDSMFCTEGDYVLVVEDVTPGVLPYGQCLPPCVLHIKVERDRSQVFILQSPLHGGDQKHGSEESTVFGENTSLLRPGTGEQTAADMTQSHGGNASVQPQPSTTTSDSKFKEQSKQNVKQLPNDIPATGSDQQAREESRHSERLLETGSPNADMNTETFMMSICKPRSIIEQFVHERATANPHEDYNTFKTFNWSRYPATRYREAWVEFVKFHCVYYFNKHAGSEDAMLKDAWVRFQQEYFARFGADESEDKSRVKEKRHCPTLRGWQGNDSVLAEYRRCWPLWFNSAEEMDTYVAMEMNKLEHRANLG
eukprot:scpid24461/ scgid0230/ MORN repeat-containing protein 1